MIHVGRGACPRRDFTPQAKNPLAARQESTHKSSFGRCEFRRWRNSRQGQAPCPTVLCESDPYIQKNRGSRFASSVFFSYFFPRKAASAGRSWFFSIIFHPPLNMIKSVRRYNRAAHRPPNVNIIPHLLSSVNSPDIQTFPLLFMEVPILQKGRTVGIIKLPQRSDSNVQVTL